MRFGIRSSLAKKWRPGRTSTTLSRNKPSQIKFYSLKAHDHSMRRTPLPPQPPVPTSIIDFSIQHTRSNSNPNRNGLHQTQQTSLHHVRKLLHLKGWVLLFLWKNDFDRWSWHLQSAATRRQLFPMLSSPVPPPLARALSLLQLPLYWIPLHPCKAAPLSSRRPRNSNLRNWKQNTKKHLDELCIACWSTQNRIRSRSSRRKRGIHISDLCRQRLRRLFWITRWTSPFSFSLFLFKNSNLNALFNPMLLLSFSSFNQCVITHRLFLRLRCNNLEQ